MGIIMLICFFVAIWALMGVVSALLARNVGEKNALDDLKKSGMILVGCIVLIGFSVIYQRNEFLESKAIEDAKKVQKAEQVQAEAKVTPSTAQVNTPAPTEQKAPPKQSNSLINASNKVSIPDLMGEPKNYLFKEVIIGPVLICENWAGESYYDVASYNTKTKSMAADFRARISYSKMDDKSKWRNLEARVKSPKTIAYIKGTVEEYDSRTIPFIVANEIVLVNE